MVAEGSSMVTTVTPFDRRETVGSGKATMSFANNINIKINTNNFDFIRLILAKKISKCYVHFAYLFF